MIPSTFTAKDPKYPNEKLISKRRIHSASFSSRTGNATSETAAGSFR